MRLIDIPPGEHCGSCGLEWEAVKVKGTELPQEGEKAHCERCGAQHVVTPDGLQYTGKKYW